MDDDPYAPVAQGAVLQDARPTVSPSPRAEHELEEESLLKEWLDPAYLRLVELVSSPTRPDFHVEGLCILAHLCRRALQRPLPLQQMRQVAECEFAGVARLCRGEEEDRYGKWPYSRETTLKWFVLLEALTVIRRFRRGGKTVIQIPLGKREPLNLAQLLSNLDDSARQYTNPKTVELLLRAKADLERYGVGFCEREEGDLLDQAALQRVQQHLLAKLQESGVSRTTSRKVALWLTGGPLAQLAKDYLQAVRAAATGTGKAIPALQGEALPVRALPGCQSDSEPGDRTTEELAQGEILLAMQASKSRLPLHGGDPELPERREEVIAHLSEGAPHRPNRLASDLLPARQGDSERVQVAATTPEPPPGIALPARRGDWAVAISNSNSFQKDSVRESELEFDTPREHHMPESPSAPIDRRAEATSLWRQLYSEEQRNAPGGTHLIGGLINKLNERADLVRLSMVNVLLQRVFPDRHGPPDGCGARWFYRSYSRYLSGELTPSPEISSWAQSPYSYQQIERALRAEYAYQQADVFCKPHRPFASCILEHRLLETVPIELGVTDRQEFQTAGQARTLSAGAGGQAEQSREAQEEPIPMEAACTPIHRPQAPAAVPEDSLGVASSANQRPHEGHKHKVVMVQDPQTGWTSLEGVLWWREQVTRTSLASTARLEVLPTVYGRYVLAVIPYDDETAAWFWSSGRQVRLALEQWRAARVQT